MAVTVDLGPRSYTVHFQPLVSVPNLMEEVGLENGRCLLATDEHVAEHYHTPLEATLTEAGWTVHTTVLPPGEETKSAPHLHRLYDEALDWGIDRDTPMLALGGGVVGDLAGFAAATLLRGIPLIQLPTSLLAQVDASVGGKTAINHRTGKNLIGAFYQPHVVCADPATLETLPRRDYTSGLAELVKHALIGDPTLFATLEDHFASILSYDDREQVASVLEQAVEVKATVVSADERESGRRAILNFGHTFAHALETVVGYGTFTHGEAVVAGMRAGLYLSHLHHPASIPRDRVNSVLRALPLENDPATISFDALWEAMAADKKNRGHTIRFVLLDRIGHAYVTSKVSRTEARDAWAYACSS